MKSTPGFLKILLIDFAVCALAALSLSAGGPQAPSTNGEKEHHGIVVANMDPTVKPGDDFYLYANGAWIAKKEIPADRSGINVFSDLADLSDKRTSSLIEEAFNVATAHLCEQYDAYMPFPDLHVNGRLTLGENIADVAGISASYDGYRAALAGKEAPSQDGFTGDQQFFIAFGQNWAGKRREASQRQQVITDPHAPAQYRAATARNIDAWYAAFGVQPGQKLYIAPQDRVRIW